MNLKPEPERHQAIIAEALAYLNDTQNPLLPEFRGSLRRYLADRMETGGFLRACLENDWHAGVTHAHPSLHLQHLREIAYALSTFPACAWGSEAKVAAWLAEGKAAEE